jgi:hypothetical protein
MADREVWYSSMGKFLNVRVCLKDLHPRYKAQLFRDLAEDLGISDAIIKAEVTESETMKIIEEKISAAWNAERLS